MAILKTQKNEMTYDTETKQAIFGNRVKTAYMPDTDPFPARMLAEAAAEGPEPVFVDPETGIEYYNKCEFDLEALVNGAYKTLDPLSGEEISDYSYPRISCHLSYGPGPDYGGSYTVAFTLGYTGIALEVIFIYSPLDASIHPDLDFTSRAFTIVETQEEVTDNTKICLPTCSAYYGYLSEDGKTFISYFNLKEE